MDDVTPQVSEETRKLTDDEENENAARSEAEPASSETVPLDPMNLDGAGDEKDRPVTGAEDHVEVEARIPHKKDATLKEFLGKMDDYAPIIPDAVTHHYLTMAGLPPPPQTSPHLARLLALATQKFIADIAADAYQFARIRSSHTTSNTAAANAMMGAGLGVPGQVPPGAPGSGVAGAGKEVEKGKAALGLGVQRVGFGGGGAGTGQGRTVLTMEDLGMAVGEYGVNIKRGEFYR